MKLKLPLKLITDPFDKNMSAVTDANRTLLAGSLILQQLAARVEFHALAVKAINEYDALCKVAEEAKAIRSHYDGDTECTEVLEMLSAESKLQAAPATLRKHTQS
jgi:hypothetical protein